MRNPERIDKILNAIRDIWKEFSDWRFGQLVSNIFSEMGYTDAFFVEDSELMKELKNIKF